MTSWWSPFQLVKEAGTTSPRSPRQSWFMSVVLGRLLIAPPFSLTSVPFCMINYMVAVGWYFQSELFQRNMVKHHWVSMWSGRKAVTNGTRQVVECVNSMKDLSIHCTEKKSNSDFVQYKWMFIGHQLCATIKNLNWQKQTIKPPQQTKQTTIESVI